MSAAVAAALLARGVLAATFGIAAVAKLRHRAATRSWLRAAGLPESLEASLATVEGFTAFGLLMERRTPWSAWVATGLLVLFSVVIVRQLRAGNRAPCPCFGVREHARPTDARTLARNVGLLAIGVVATGRTGRDQWLVWLAAAAVVLAINVASAAVGRVAR